MPFLLLFLFLAYPLLEIALLIRVGGLIGLWPTLALIVGTAMLGLATLRRQGLIVMRRAADAMREGRPPVEPVLEGALFGFAGLLLIVPGLVSDVLGLSLLLPPVRRLIARMISRSLVTVSGADGGVHGRGQGDDGGPAGERARSTGAQAPIVIEGEFTRIDERPVPREDDASKDAGTSNRRA